MKDDKPFVKDEELSRLLHTWKLDAQLPPRFKERVWQRIERGESVKIAFWKVQTETLVPSQMIPTRPSMATSR